jgi:hypothetical protein
MEWLAKMRSRSDASKSKIAIVFAAAITLLIVGLWLLVLKNKKTDEAVIADSKKEELKPLFMIFSNAKQEFKTIKTNAKTYKANSIDANASSTVIE